MYWEALSTGGISALPNFPLSILCKVHKNKSVVLVPYTAESAVIASFFPLQKLENK